MKYIYEFALVVVGSLLADWISSCWKINQTEKNSEILSISECINMIQSCCNELCLNAESSIGSTARPFRIEATQKLQDCKKDTASLLGKEICRELASYITNVAKAAGNMPLVHPSQVKNHSRLLENTLREKMRELALLIEQKRQSFAERALKQLKRVLNSSRASQ